MDQPSRLQRTVAAIAALAVVGAGVELAFASPSIAADTNFSAVGTSSYTVPGGVHALKVVARGAGGGKMFGDSGNGGAGAVVTAYRTVNPGDVLTIKVGSGGAGSLNGGGGGAATAVFLGTTADSQAIVAGGGGGAGGPSDGGTGAATGTPAGSSGGAVNVFNRGRGSTDPNSGGDGGGLGVGGNGGVATSNGANGGSSGAARGGGGGGGWNGGGGGLASGGGGGATGASTSGGSNGDGGGGSGFGGGGGGFGGGGGGGYSGGGGGGSSNGTLLAGGGAGGSHAPSPAGWPAAIFAPGSNGGQANLGGNGRVTITEIFDQVVVGKCVKVRKLPSKHKKKVMKRNCVTNAGQQVTVSSSSKRAKFVKVTKGKKSKRGTYVKTKVRKKGKRKAVTITWSAPATATFTAYVKQKTYRI